MVLFHKRRRILPNRAVFSFRKAFSWFISATKFIHNVFLLARPTSLCACHHTPIFQRINIIAVTTRNNLISDVNGADYRFGQNCMCRLYQHDFGRSIAVSSIAPHFPEFIDSIELRWMTCGIELLKGILFVVFLFAFCFVFRVPCLLAFGSIAETEKEMFKRKYPGIVARDENSSLVPQVAFRKRVEWLKDIAGRVETVSSFMLKKSLKSCRERKEIKNL